MSLVDAVMRAESRFAELDFPTRDHYRRAIEALAEQSDLDEVDVAVRVVGAAKRSEKKRRVAGIDAGRDCDPGYFLVAEGRRALEEELGCRVPVGTLIYRGFADKGISSYIAVVALATFVIVVFGELLLVHLGVDGLALAALALVGSLPASELAISMTNRVITQRVGAMQLPGLELGAGVPDALRTIIVVPTLLTSEETIDEHVERLEVHYLANSDDNFTFALLSDWADAEQESVSGDDTLLAAAARGIARTTTRATARPPVEIASCSCTVDGSGMRAREGGSVGNANAASCTSLIVCCGVRRTQHFWSSTGVPHRFRLVFVMSSHWMQTRVCRYPPVGGLLERSLIL